MNVIVPLALMNRIVFDILQRCVRTSNQDDDDDDDDKDTDDDVEEDSSAFGLI